MRLTGAALLTAAGLLAGLAKARALRMRADELDGLCRMLERMGFELGRFRTPLPKLFAALAAQMDGQSAALCARAAEGLERLGEQDMAGIWAGALSPLEEREQAALLPLGQVLGRYGTEELLLALDGCRADMERLRDAARIDSRDRGRVAIGVSAAGAAALAVLLL